MASLKRPREIGLGETVGEREGETTVGDKAVVTRETPIYVEFELGWKTGRYFWFAIEEKDEEEEEHEANPARKKRLKTSRLKESSISVTPSDSDLDLDFSSRKGISIPRVYEIESDEEGEDDDETESKSSCSYYKALLKGLSGSVRCVDKGHRIRQLYLLPEPEIEGNLKQASFLIFNSRVHMRHGEIKKEFGAVYFDDDWIYTVGYPLYGLSPKSLECPENAWNFPRVLGVTKTNTNSTKLFVYMEGRRSHDANTMFCYDSELGEWEIINKSFWGEWSTGVVLQFSSSSSYLFSIGTQNPTERNDRSLPSMYAFDINRSQWLPKPVAGLSNFLPNSHDHAVWFPSLLQIQNHVHTKLALVWYTDVSRSKSKYEIYWSKFYLHQGRIPSNFFAEVVSFGDFSVEHKLDLLLRNCTAGL